MGKKDRRFAGTKVPIGEFISSSSGPADPQIPPRSRNSDKKQSSGGPTQNYWRDNENSAKFDENTSDRQSSNYERRGNKSNYGNKQRNEEQSGSGSHWREQFSSANNASSHQKTSDFEKEHTQRREESDGRYQNKQKNEERSETPSSKWRQFNTDQREQAQGHGKTDNRHQNQQRNEDSGTPNAWRRNTNQNKWNREYNRSESNSGSSYKPKVVEYSGSQSEWRHENIRTENKSKNGEVSVRQTMWHQRKYENEDGHARNRQEISSDNQDKKIGEEISVQDAPSQIDDISNFTISDANPNVGQRKSYPENREDRMKNRTEEPFVPNNRSQRDFSNRSASYANPRNDQRRSYPGNEDGRMRNRTGDTFARNNRPQRDDFSNRSFGSFSNEQKRSYPEKSGGFRNFTQEYSEKYKEFLDWRKAKSGKESKCTITEEKGDLFTAPPDFSLCHCVAEDLSMGSGIAVAFKEKFKRVDELMEQRQKTGGVAILKDESRFIYYLVTKQLSRGKPTNDTLLESLIKMKDHIVAEEVTKLAMPTIGCGLDRLIWEDVLQMLQFVFQDVQIQIVVYIFEQKEEGDESGARAERKVARIVNREHPLVDIESCTILTFIASIDHTPTPQIEELNKKFNFLQDYQQDKNGKLGDNFYITKRNETIVGLYVKEKANDPFSFTNFVSCLKKLNSHFKKSDLYCIGLDAFADENDELIMDKLKILFRNHLIPGFEVYICEKRNSIEN